ncbi:MULTISPECIES: PilT/PilU family type 4a pilus ATPase [unclassified Oceanobacter]|jgi:twitching motility protein PilU|uniref:PilT/PilU family type 4a pilus ATPase n=1 Tax=unclassified Oceanobacter TaxID=2620260 RepID=UPI0026E20109|nr:MULTISPECIES: PilT/PilU family type 4a pilus ATPase [unclassified Oceanobacter]MDO6683588.1 PilT/PilU family type 4a pilus ATPase [Oceanobacter sp. 5_MG-2023]MDP2506917.1 PilT/PilU family type 4a pilus ATPase [Oceanobacter sp. 3_MG-2023]MDP2547756.1 PilT/PilU family type 4a pilus ATPase [Oceanobacter sp. 4_MG-2023]MDP2608468.1 PilT/PilU family type 4a pilus ATPase [Oceanobacter sp. 1_MG-2023]MDP2611563.1 PilT/PilU family type 4a pilus ATPase [Oceanobacter sp. 2_MG-2023]
MSMDKFLRLMVDKGASDLFITAGVAPSMKVNGQILPLSKSPLAAEQTRDIVLGLMNSKQQDEFESTKELNFAINARGIGRFRASAFYQRNVAGMVLRRIETRIPSVDQLGLPEIIKELAMTKRGLILFVGATGTGKSTSLASMIGFRNHNSKGHILSIEDPIEYIHQHDGCIITQREVGLDTESFEVALRNCLRQAPDVIMIGEVRSPEIMENAVTFAETGHLCLATLHANNANQALERVIHFFPPERHGQVWMDLSLNLKAIIAQQLIPTPDGRSRRAVIEVLINTPLASDLIRKGEVHALKPLMRKSTEAGMQTFDQALYHLYEQGEITYEDALAHADSANDLRLMIKLASESDAEHLTGMSKSFKLEN